MIIKDGAKMSKSKGNVVNPDRSPKNTALTHNGSIRYLSPHHSGMPNGTTGASSALPFPEQAME